MKSYARFYPKIWELLQQAPNFSSREEAALWLRDAWHDIHLSAGASSRRLRILKTARICEAQGWKNIDQDVCYLDSPDNPPIRLYLHKDGGMVFQQLQPGQNQILFAKPGKRVLSTTA